MSAEGQPPVPAANDEQSALANLKALLLGAEQSRIAELQHEAKDPDVQQRRVADSLPHSLHQAYADSPDALTRAMEAPVSACIEDSVQRNPGFFADILFPIMGPAIRRSISQALKGLVQQINQTLEHSLTLKGLKWRIEAARSGVPFAEVVLRHTLRYRVEEAFLIQTGSGLLIQHVGQGPTDNTDADAVSAMLTAIRDFARDTLHEEDSDSRLETVDVGEHTLWLVYGPRAYVACAIRGVPPVSLRDELARVVEEIHQRHARVLESFDGDSASAAPVVPLLERCLRSEAEPQARKRLPWPLLIALVIVIGLAAWALTGLWQDQARDRAHLLHLDSAFDQLRQAPGIVITDHQVADGRLQLQGLHDPLTEPPDVVLRRAGLTSADYTLSFRAFESSDPEAALARARQRLTPPPGVELSLDADGVLVADGIAAATWRQRAELLAATVPGVSAFDSDRLGDIDQRLLQQLNAALQPPADVTIAVAAGRATVAGTAPLAWIRALRATPPALTGLVDFDATRLRAQELDRLAELDVQIDAATIPFTEGVEFDAAARERVAAVAELIGEAYQHALDLDLAIRLHVIGRTDGIGSIERNHFIATQRAAVVIDTLRASDDAMPPIDLHTVIQPEIGSEPDIPLRRVEFRIQRANGEPLAGLGTR